MASDFKESPSNYPGLHATPDEVTRGYIMQHTDPKVYSGILGISLLKRLDFAELKFSLYLVDYEDTLSGPNNPIEHSVWTFGLNFIKHSILTTLKNIVYSCLDRSKSRKGGEIKGVAFINDPDGYWIEIFESETIGNVTAGAA